MQFAADRLEAPTAIRTDLGAIFISLELSRSSWVVTSLSPGGGEKMSKHTARGGDVAGLLKRFAQLAEKAKGRTGKVFPLIVIHEAGLDGFWIDRVLQNEGIESHVVDPATIATSRRRLGEREPARNIQAAPRSSLSVPTKSRLAYDFEQIVRCPPLLPLKGRDDVRLRTASKSFLIFKDFCSSARKQFGL